MQFSSIIGTVRAPFRGWRRVAQGGAGWRRVAQGGAGWRRVAQGGAEGWRDAHAWRHKVCMTH